MILAPVIAHSCRAGFNPPAPFVTPASPAPQGEDMSLHPEEDGAPAPSVSKDAKEAP